MIIRDPVYNYIHLTSIEETVVDHKLFQRLRYISQDGTAWLTYPSNKTCRFLHSLGTMKLAGDVAAKVFSNTSDPVVREFLLDFYEFMGDSCGGYVEITSVIGSLLSNTDDHEVFSKFGICFDLAAGKNIDSNFLSGDESAPYKILFAKATVFQSMRIAALLHDIGHFCFSHAIEGAVSPYLNLQGLRPADAATHERVGAALLKVIMPDSRSSDFNKLCRNIAYKILYEYKKEPDFSMCGERVIDTLHTMISGELDVDRLDYCARDPKSSGLELGAFDVERIINNLKLVRDKKNPERRRILPHVRAVSAIESFFSQRYFMYKFLIYHHNKLRTDSLLAHIVKELADISKASDADERGVFLKERHFNYLWQEFRNEKFFICTDGWLLSILADFREKFSSKPENDGLCLMIDTILERKTQNLYSLFKRYDQYVEFINAIKSKTSIHEHICAEQVSLIIDDQREKTEYPAAFEKISELENKYSVKCLFRLTPPKTGYNIPPPQDSSGYVGSNISYISAGAAGTVCSPLQPEGFLLDIVDDSGEICNIVNYSQFLLASCGYSSFDQKFSIFLFGEDIKSKPDIISRAILELQDILSDSIKI